MQGHFVLFGDDAKCLTKTSLMQMVNW